MLRLRVFDPPRLAPYRQSHTARDQRADAGDDQPAANQKTDIASLTPQIIQCSGSKKFSLLGKCGARIASNEEKVAFNQKMAEIDEAGTDDGQSPPPSLTPI
jgi:hypothetical protein